ncbi:MAG: NAD(P)-dependent oxidoreductase [Anaerolineae bacterium]|nr:NAD(P)-dependent oxidoreductase [Anaerolineae bacterium]
MADNQETAMNQDEQQPLNIFITGGDNGVGLTLAREAVKNGHNVFAASSKGTIGAKRISNIGAYAVYPELTREGSLRSAIMLAKADVVVNCAAQDIIGLPQYRIDTGKIAATIEESAEALVAAAGKLGVKRLIHLSPAYIYGNTDDAVTEDAHIVRGSKLLNHVAEAEEAILDGGIAGYVVRTGFIYGGWHDSMLALAELMRTGKGIAKGKGQASWIHEDDLALALLKLVELSSDDATANVLNISDGEPMSHSDFMSLFGELYGSGEPNGINPLFVPLRTNPTQIELLNQNTVIDSSKAREVLDWEPKTASKAAGIEKAMLVWRALEASDDTPSTATDSKALVKV